MQQPDCVRYSQRKMRLPLRQDASDEGAGVLVRRGGWWLAGPQVLF
jgi:hypothetical protein